MSCSTNMQSDWHRVGAGFSVRFSLTAGRFDAEWRPHMPTRRTMKRVLDRYRSARDGFLAEAGRAGGGPVLVLEKTL